MRLIVTPKESPLRGVVPGPIDAEAATYALAIAALAQGHTSVLEGRGLPELPVVAALEALGVKVEVLTDVEGRRSGYRVLGIGFGGMRRPNVDLDAGASKAAMACLAAVGACLPFATRLVGNPEVMRDVMAPIARVLRMRSGTIEGRIVLGAPSPHHRARPGQLEPPFEVGPTDVPLSPLTYELGEAEAWPEVREFAKAAALLSGIDADGSTQLYERIVSHDVVERMLTAAGASIQSLGPMLELEGPVTLKGLNGLLPVDPSLAAALLGAALHRPESRLGVRRVPTRPTAMGWLEALSDAGAGLHFEPKHDALGQPAADVTLFGALERPIALGGERAQRVGISLPVLAAIASRAPEGATSTLFDCANPNGRNNEILVRTLGAFGVEAAVVEEGLVVRGVGTRRLRAAEVDCQGDTELALACVMLAVGAEGPCSLGEISSLLSRFPRLVATFRAVGTDLVLAPAGASSEPTACRSL